MPGHLKEYPGAGIPSTPEGCQSFCASSTAITATSSIKSEEGLRSQEEESSPGTSLALLDPRSVPICSRWGSRFAGEFTGEFPAVSIKWKSR